MAFESVALLSTALKLIEIKNFGLVRFGAAVEIISQFGEEMNDNIGIWTNQRIFSGGDKNGCLSLILV